MCTWDHNKQHGPGKAIYSETLNTYEGMFEYGKRAGIGTFKFYQKAKGSREYTGQWLNDQMHG